MQRRGINGKICSKKIVSLHFLSVFSNQMKSLHIQQRCFPMIATPSQVENIVDLRYLLYPCFRHCQLPGSLFFCSFISENIIYYIGRCNQSNRYVFAASIQRDKMLVKILFILAIDSTFYDLKRQ